MGSYRFGPRSGGLTSASCPSPYGSSGPIGASAVNSGPVGWAGSPDTDGMWFSWAQPFLPAYLRATG